MKVEHLIMTPGPTMVNEEVRRAASLPLTNPDLDPEFPSFYQDLCSKLGSLMATKNDVIILSGEGMLGLEAAIASFIEPHEKVLCFVNGVFGRGLADFVKMYGATPVLFEKDFNDPFTEQEAKQFCADHPDAKVATLVHCETPSALLNPVQEIGPALKQAGVLSIVDAVSSLGGEPVDVDQNKLDVVIGASQKCLSAPPGLAFLSISENGWDKIRNRKTAILNYYLNLDLWRNIWIEKKSFPYTQSTSNLQALHAAVEKLIQEGNRAYHRHARCAAAVRETLNECGFSLYTPEQHASNTVTTFGIPENLDDCEFRNHLWNSYQVMMAGSLGSLNGKFWRIGHMGENAREDYLFHFFRAFEKALIDFGHPLSELTSTVFSKTI